MAISKKLRSEYPQETTSRGALIAGLYTEQILAGKKVSVNKIKKFVSSLSDKEVQSELSKAFKRDCKGK